jgi:hypothetical protein
MISVMPIRLPLPLVISFYDVTNSSIKNATNLKYGEGMTDGVVFNSSLINGTVSIPLKTNADATTFSFILNSGSTNPALVNEHS